MVPHWFQILNPKKLAGSSLDPGTRFVACFFLLYLAYGFFHLRVLTDWVGFAVNEGHLSYSAILVREGKIPYLDFLHPGAPGMIGIFALLQKLGFGLSGERFVSLFASAISGFLVLRWAIDLGFSKWEKILLAGLILVWGFCLWNVSDPGWLTLALVLLGVRSGQYKKWFLAGLLMVAAFWCEPVMGAFAALGLVAALFLRGEKKEAGYFFLLFSTGILLPFLALFVGVGREELFQTLSQFFKVPTLDESGLASSLLAPHLAAPLAALGVWLLSLYFFRATPRIQTLAMAAVVVYASVGLMREGRTYYVGSFVLLSLLAWITSLLALLQSSSEIRRKALFPWICFLAIFFSVYVRLDFSRFLILFPIAALFLVWFFSWITKKYTWLPPVWVHLPAIFLLLGGGVHQARVNLFHLYGRVDALEAISFGDGHLLNEEMGQVREYLTQSGLRGGSPLLIFPPADLFYRFSGYRNPVKPFAEVGYPSQALDAFVLAGGDYVLVRRNSVQSLGSNLAAALEKNFRLEKNFAAHFGVWKKIEKR